MSSRGHPARQHRRRSPREQAASPLSRARDTSDRRGRASIEHHRAHAGAGLRSSGRARPEGTPRRLPWSSAWSRAGRLVNTTRRPGAKRCAQKPPSSAGGPPRGEHLGGHLPRRRAGRGEEPGVARQRADGLIAAPGRPPWSGGARPGPTRPGGDAGVDRSVAVVVFPPDRRADVSPAGLRPRTPQRRLWGRPSNHHAPALSIPAETDSEHAARSGRRCRTRCRNDASPSGAWWRCTPWGASTAGAVVAALNRLLARPDPSPVARARGDPEVPRARSVGSSDRGCRVVGSRPGRRLRKSVQAVAAIFVNQTGTAPSTRSALRRGGGPIGECGVQPAFASARTGAGVEQRDLDLARLGSTRRTSPRSRRRAPRPPSRAPRGSRATIEGCRRRTRRCPPPEGRSARRA